MVLHTWRSTRKLGIFMEVAWTGMRYALFDTAWGAFAFVERDERVVATYLPDSAAKLRRKIRNDWLNAKEVASTLPGLRRQVVDYFKGQPVKFDVKLDLSDITPFRQSVLKACRRIPRGKTATYSDLAQAVGKPGAARAVGSAMSHNPVPLIVPCHRVVRSNGSLGGFSSPTGVDEKARMLRLERCELVA